ncbi:hypothetical protein [endosymbiont 'TC1' of Trimyema compressum]|uniref:hypothetical protein n=1 Tax=endosymbiont 'TC1' of Trimyema compressum TaxID=243899 RepID=UPI000AD70E7C|nr:hypothetical protein [endosymbiont 'TC1' of Trimyema compressum]
MHSSPKVEVDREVKEDGKVEVDREVKEDGKVEEDGESYLRSVTDYIGLTTPKNKKK